MPKCLALCFFAAVFFSLPCLAGSVYKSVGPDGKVTYTEVPPSSGSTETKFDIPSKAPPPKEDPVVGALKVYAWEVIVETAYRFCRDEVPQSAGRVKKARDAWMERNADLREKKIDVLHDQLPMAALRKIAAQAERDNEATLRVIKEAPLEERTKWCRETPSKFAAPELDPSANPGLVSAIMNYKPKN